jgi:hypothetical protein
MIHGGVYPDLPDDAAWWQPTTSGSTHSSPCSSSRGQQPSARGARSRSGRRDHHRKAHWKNVRRSKR